MFIIKLTINSSLVFCKHIINSKNSMIPYFSLPRKKEEFSNLDIYISNL